MIEEKPRDRTGQPVVIPARETRPQQIIVGDDETGRIVIGIQIILERGE